MKMNNEVKMYIRRLINKKAEEKTSRLNTVIDEENKKFREVNSDYIKALDEIEHEALIKARQLAKKYKMSYSGHFNKNSIDELDLSDLRHRVSTTRSSVFEKTYKELEELNKRIDLAIDDTIARMSLGGTAKELDEIVNGLVF